MKDNYINNEIANLTKEEEKIKKRTKVMEYIKFLSPIFFGSLAVTTIAVIPPAGATCAGVALASHLYAKKDIQLKKKELERIEKEKSHLNSIRATSPTDTADLNRRRHAKLIGLKRSRDIKQAKANASIAAANIGGVVGTITAGLATINPIFLIGTAVGFGMQHFMTKNNLSTKEDLETCKNRINNIERDVKVINIERSSRRTTRTTTTTSNNGQNTRNNTRQRTTTNNAPQQTTPTNTSSSNQSLVNSYVNSQANNTPSQPKTKKKVK